FPDLPMLGVDILKDAVTGKLMVTEVNALGHNWNFTPEFLATFRVDIARQFDGLRKAAYVLAEETQRRAGLLATASGIGEFRMGLAPRCLPGRVWAQRPRQRVCPLSRNGL